MSARIPRRSLILAGASALALSACGFRLRGPQEMAFDTVFVGGVGQYSRFGAELRRQIEAAGTTRVVGTPAEAEVRLDILGNERDREILSIAGDGSVREYQIDRILVYRIRDKAGNELVPPTQLRTRREYDFDDAQIIAKQREEALLFEDMERDLMQQLVRRLAAVRP
jgi:LPS-assembly lipoprotein